MKRILLVIILTLLAFPAALRAQDDLKDLRPSVADAAYRGSDDALVIVDGREITERELFWFQLVALRYPFVARDWRRAVEQGDTGRLALLRQELRFMIMMRFLAEEYQGSGAPPLDPMLLPTAKRLLASAVTRILWLDSRVSDRIIVHPEDIIFHYRTNWRDFAEPQRARILRARIPIPQPVTGETLEVARARARALRERALVEGGLAPILSADPSLIADPNGQPIEVERGRSPLDTQTLDAAFGLGITEISQPLETGTALYLVEVLVRSEPRIPPLAEVRDEIESALRQKFLPQQGEYLLLKLAKEARAINRSPLYPFLPEDVDLFRVREFGVTKQEFAAMFPDLVGDPANPRRTAIVDAVQRFIDGEIVTQDLEKYGELQSPEYDRALTYAETLLKALAVGKHRAFQAKPTEEELDAYILANRERIMPQGARTLWRLAIEPRKPAELTPEERETIRLVNAAVLRDHAAQAQQQLRERAEIAGAGAYENPAPVIDNLPKPDDDRVRLRFAPIGPYEPGVARDQLAVEISDLLPGQFSRVASQANGAVVCYYVANIQPVPELTTDELRARAWGAYALDYASQNARTKFREMESDGRLRFSFPSTPAANE